MIKRAVAVTFALIAIMFVWWRHRDESFVGTPATGSGSGSAVARGSAPVAATPAALARVTVTVTDAHGPIAGAIVRLRPDDGDVLVLHTGADGVARASSLAAGDWAVSASAIDHAPGAAPTATLHAGDDAHLAITLAPGGKPLTGTITDATGGPIAGARIDAALLDTRAKPADAVATATSGADGKYKLFVAEGQLVVAVSDPDYAPVARFVNVGPAGATADFALVPGGALEGVVRDEHTHEPVAGANVEAHRDSAGITLAEAGTTRVVTAGADGHFRLAGLPPGNYELRANADTRTTRTPTAIGLGVAEQRSDLEVLIGAGPIVRGMVVDELGAAVGGAHVFADGPGARVEATAEATGTFAIVGLHAGRYRVSANTETHLPAGNVPVEIGALDVNDVRVIVHRGAEVHGHVEPRQIADVTIGAEARGDLAAHPLAPITTAADGSFTFHPVADGPTKLDARAPSGAAGTAVVTVGKDLGEVVIQLAPGGTIAGHVVDGDGKPVAAVTVMAVTTGDSDTTIVNGMITSGTQTITDPAGAYELRGLTPGGYALRVLDRGHPLALRTKPEAARVKLGDGDHKTVELAIDRAIGTIRGTVVGSDGAPIADAWVSVSQNMADILAGLDDHGGGSADTGPHSGYTSVMTDDDDDSVTGAGATPPALTDATGHFEIGGLVVGKYQVVAEALAGRARGRAADVVPDATITITAVAPTELAGTVHGVAGPTALFSVELRGPTAASRGFADPGGNFSFGRVDPGAYTVHVTSADGTGDGAVVVVSGQRATVDIALIASAIVTGKLVDPSGAPVVGVPVAVIADTHTSSLSVTMNGIPPASGPDGRFRIEAAPGDAVFLAMVRPRPVTQRGLKLVAGQTTDLGNVTITATPAPAAPTPAAP